MKKLFLTILMLGLSLPVLSQVRFADLKLEVERWLKDQEQVAVNNSKKPKFIEFHDYHYTLEGIITKGVLEEGTVAKFYDISSLVPKPLLEGKVSYQAGRLVVNGVKFSYLTDRTNKVYGTFYVHNMDDFSMNYKNKKAGELRISCIDAKYAECFHGDSPAILKLSGAIPMAYIDGKSGVMSVEVPGIKVSDTPIDMVKVLMGDVKKITVNQPDGVVFRGIARPSMFDENKVQFLPLEGQKTGMKSGPNIISVRKTNGNIVYTQENEGGSKTVLFVKDNGTLSEENYWNAIKYYEHCFFVQLTYEDGRYFEGTAKHDIATDEAKGTTSVKTTPVRGLYKYPNGDRFEGNLTTKLAGPFFTDGTTFFANGSTREGNWLEGLELTNSQREKVYACNNPSDALTLAQDFSYSNFYQEYTYPCEYPDYPEILYFNPEEERDSRIYKPRIIHDKKNNTYRCVFGDNKQTELEFAVDEKGQRSWEIVYASGKPTFINRFTWYSNGVVNTINSYYYKTKKLYLSCNFFSDGKLRSAYKYASGNNGKNILRKSKESHPTLGGYTSKLYDLDGRYERDIQWKIGTDESMWGTYETKMAPKHLIFNNLKPVKK